MAAAHVGHDFVPLREGLNLGGCTPLEVAQSVAMRGVNFTNRRKNCRQAESTCLRGSMKPIGDGGEAENETGDLFAICSVIRGM